jgi:hypothetical protein
MGNAVKISRKTDITVKNKQVKNDAQTFYGKFPKYSGPERAGSGRKNDGPGLF